MARQSYYLYLLTDIGDKEEVDEVIENGIEYPHKLSDVLQNGFLTQKNGINFIKLKKTVDMLKVTEDYYQGNFPHAMLFVKASSDLDLAQTVYHIKPKAIEGVVLFNGEGKDSCKAFYTKKKISEKVR